MGLIIDLSYEELESYFNLLEQPKYRAAQVWDWIFKKKVLDFEKMSNLPPKLKETLKANFDPFPLVETVSTSQDFTEKYLWRLSDGELIESVLLHYLTSYKSWVSACISTQVGCPVRCSFCQTGLSGFRRNLTAGEILAQVLGMEIHSGVQVSRVLFMGMGEPLLNFKATLKSIKALIHEKGYNFSGRKITLSTVGTLELEDFVESGLRIEIAYSLHFPEEKQRREMIPYPRLLSIEKALSLLENYTLQAGRNVSIEYLMLDNVNDTFEHAQKLVKLLKGKPFFVNLLPFNPVASSFLASRPGKISKFRQILQDAGIKATIRKPRGLEIEAACGQLRLKYEK
jgi:23S rRNA (adenine2503-C2)-methyltransferase